MPMNTPAADDGEHETEGERVAAMPLGREHVRSPFAHVRSPGSGASSRTFASRRAARRCCGNFAHIEVDRFLSARSAGAAAGCRRGADPTQAPAYWRRQLLFAFEQQRNVRGVSPRVAGDEAAIDEQRRRCVGGLEDRVGDRAPTLPSLRAVRRDGTCARHRSGRARRPTDSVATPACAAPSSSVTGVLRCCIGECGKKPLLLRRAIAESCQKPTRQKTRGRTASAVPRKRAAEVPAPRSHGCERERVYFPATPKQPCRYDAKS